MNRRQLLASLCALPVVGKLFGSKPQSSPTYHDVPVVAREPLGEPLYPMIRAVPPKAWVSEPTVELRVQPTAGTLYLSLHTEDPRPGVPTEIEHVGYQRVPVKVEFQ